MALAVLAFTSGCGGGGGGSSRTPTPGPNPTASYSVGGTVTGLTGSLVLQNNGSNNLTVSANGAFSFAQPVTAGGSYNVTIATQPSGQSCSVSAASGTASSNVTTVAITCTNTYAIGGTVTGLSGTLVLQNNGGDDRSVSADGPFTFAQSVQSGATYNVTIASQPSGSRCVLAGASGTATSNINSVAVTCTSSHTIAGTVSGLKGPMVLQNNGTDDLAVANGAFVFATPVKIGGTYEVMISSHSALQDCDVTNGKGTVNANVTNVDVVCSDHSVNATLTYRQTKLFHFNWNAVSGATHYRLLESPNGTSGFSQVGADLSSGATSYDHIAALHARLNAKYIVQACDASICVDSSTLGVAVAELTQAIGYLKSSNTDQDDHFGDSLALSADGSTLVVGNWGEDSNGVGVNGNQADNSASSRGAAYVFHRAGLVWVQQAYLKPSYTSNGFDNFGHSVAISATGDTLVVGAPGESGADTGVNGDQTDLTAAYSGAVYAFRRVGSAWSQQAYIKASNTDAGDQFGYSVALSADGTTLAVGAVLEQSTAVGVNADQTDDTGRENGAVYVFSHASGNWAQQAYIKGANTYLFNQFGYSLALTADGNTLAVGTPYEASLATGINGDGSNQGSYGAGAVYVFIRISGAWTQQAYIKASNTALEDFFGWSVALAADGSTLAVGAWKEDSSATGINGNQANDSATTSGAVYVFSRSATTWAQQAYVKPNNTLADQSFGYAVTLSGDGNRLAVTAWGEVSSTKGLNAGQNVAPGGTYGAVYVFERNVSDWTQQAFVKASNTDMGDFFGWAVALSSDGDTLAVSAVCEDSLSRGINDDQANDPVTYFDSGAVYLY